MKQLAVRIATLSLPVTAAILASQPVAAQDVDEAPIDWQARTIDDVRAAHQLMLENHPGPMDTREPEFLKSAEKALASALKLANEAHSALMWKYSLKSYAAQYRDVHFSIYADDREESPAPRWPGFVVAWRKGKVLVHTSEDEARFPVGSEVVACDGKAAKSCIEDALFRFHGNSAVAGSWTTETPMLMYDDGNPYVSLPQTVDLRLPDGATSKKKLTWSEIGDVDVWREHRNQAVDGPRYPTSIEKLPEGTWWIRLTDFQPDEAEQDRFDQVAEEIASNIAAIRSSKAIVLDLRRNNGGSSYFPRAISKAIWGQAYTAWRKSRRPEQSTFVEWRASQANVETMAAYLPMLVEQGWGEEDLAGFHELIEGLRNAATTGDKLYRQSGSDSDDESKEKPETPEVGNPVAAAVFVVISGRCASAGLDAIDQFKLYPGVTLVGAPTSADTNYMEIRQDELPSGKATLYSPMKVYRNRPRASGFVYEPDVEYGGLDWSDETFRPWLLSAIEERLERR